MFKQVMIGLFAVSMVMLLWSEASAAKTCLTWIAVGGSNVCTVWKTKGVLLEVTTDGQCGPSGEDCSFQCDATTNNSIAFCQAGSGPIIRRECTAPLTFIGSEVGCEPTLKHGDKDNDGVGGGGHEKNHNECTTLIPLVSPLTECTASCCNPGAITGETCIDVTPVTMETTLQIVAVGGEEESSVITIEEECSINPNKIGFNAIRPYQCELLFAGPPPPTD